jgi:Questin oxidase-like
MTSEQDDAGETTRAPGTTVGKDPQALDEAYDRMATSDFELPNGFVNHGPMACEALATLGCEEAIDPWARWFTQMVGEGPTPVAPRSLAEFDWQDALGAYERLPEWLGYFDGAVASDGWSSVAELWLPRLLPGLATALFHGAIRTAHAVRAVVAVETSPRRTELARALAYWAARFRPGQPTEAAEPVEEVVRSLSDAAANAAGHYLAVPNIFNLHGVTGAMALELLVDHIGPEARLVALAQIQAEHAAMFVGTHPVGRVERAEHWNDELAGLAATSSDAHQVKLVEACRRGFAIGGDPLFAAAAERVSGKR